MSALGPSVLGFDHFCASDEQRREALFSLGNGVLSWRACSPEACAMPGIEGHYPGLYRAGWYDDAPRQVNGTTTRVAALVNLPDPFGLTFSVDGQQWFEPGMPQLIRYHQEADMQRGLLTRELQFSLSGHVLKLLETRFVSLDDPDLAVLRWELHSEQPLPGLWIRSTLDSSRGNALVERDRAYEGRRLRCEQWLQQTDGDAGVLAVLDSVQRRVAVVARTLGAQQWQVERNDDRLSMQGWAPWPSEGPLVLEKRILARVDDEFIDLADMCQAIPDVSFQALLQAHESAWQHTWRQGRVRVADPDIDLPLQFAGWHIQQTLSELSIGRDQGFPARGWQEGYFGQVFWDELFAFGLLASHRPELARTLLDYRHARLPAARRRAAELGLEGALFPWRSAHDGEEHTPPWLYYPLSEHWVPDPTYLQRHIGSAVAYDAWALYLATANHLLLAGPVGEIVVEVARCWASMARFDESRERFVIDGVIGPDEYHNAYPGADKPGLNNNAYTNVMAVWTLCRALEVLQRLPAQLRDGFTSRLGLRPGETERWELISRRMYLPFTDEGLLDQFEGFDRLKPAPKDWTEGDHPRLDWMLEERGDSCDHYQVSKQADTLMLLYLMPPAELTLLIERQGYFFDESTLRRTVDYHLGHVCHESSLSETVCAGALAHLDGDASWQHLLACLRIDLDAAPDSGVREGVHMAAMAGSLDVVQRHYLGISPSIEGLRIFPAPPAALGDVELSLLFHGQWLDVHRAGGQTSVRLAAAATEPVIVLSIGGAHTLLPGATLAVADAS